MRKFMISKEVKATEQLANDSLPNPLSKNTQGHGNKETVTISLGFKHIDITRRIFGFSFQRKRLFNFGHFKGN